MTKLKRCGIVLSGNGGVLRIKKSCIHPLNLTKKCDKLTKLGRKMGRLWKILSLGV